MGKEHRLEAHATLALRTVERSSRAISEASPCTWSEDVTALMEHASSLCSVAPSDAFQLRALVPGLGAIHFLPALSLGMGETSSAT